MNGLPVIGVEIGNSKYELLIVNHTNNNALQTSKLFQKQLSQFSPLSIPDPNQWQLRGSPSGSGICPTALRGKTKMFDNIIDNFELIALHQTLFILKIFISIPKYLLRNASYFTCKEELEAFDSAIKTNRKNMQCDFWKRKLVTSIPTNLTWRPWPSFRYRPVFAMFSVIVLYMYGPCQQFASLS